MGENLIVRSRAPLRISFGGGGTEIDPYRSNYGGEVLSTTISLYAYTTITNSSTKDMVIFCASDLQIKETYKVNDLLKNNNVLNNSKLKIHLASYIDILKNLDDKVNKSIEVVTYCDAPPGSGLGSSSTLTVSMIEALNRRFDLNFDKNEIAQKAFHIERELLDLKGGQQDQYAASFGGFNHIFFKKNGKVIVDPLNLSNDIKCELEASLILFYTGISRDSGRIIEEQIKRDSSGDVDFVKSLNILKKKTGIMKQALINKDIYTFGSLLHDSWLIKRALSNLITNSTIDQLYKIIKSNGAYGGKISGAGGGGFFTVICNPSKKGYIQKKLLKYDIEFFSISITGKGVESWVINSKG